jgi:V/A-type H+-transporting ATPase subunit D
VTTPSRSAVLELKDERRAMREGHAFLDEKCLLLAGEMLRGLERYESLRAAFDVARREALAALDAAIARHGLDGLQAYPRADGEAATLRATPRSVMGVRLLDAELDLAPSTAPAPVDPSPEAEACRRAHARLVALAVPLAASAGNLERLRLEYRRAMRRARALQDVLIPEVAASLNAMETRLEELEQEEAVVMRRAAFDV